MDLVLLVMISLLDLDLVLLKWVSLIRLHLDSFKHLEEDNDFDLEIVTALINSEPIKLGWWVGAGTYFWETERKHEGKELWPQRDLIDVGFDRNLFLYQAVFT